MLFRYSAHADVTRANCLRNASTSGIANSIFELLARARADARAELGLLAAEMRRILIRCALALSAMAAGMDEAKPTFSE